MRFLHLGTSLEIVGKPFNLGDHPMHAQHLSQPKCCDPLGLQYAIMQSVIAMLWIKILECRRTVKIYAVDLYDLFSTTSCRSFREVDMFDGWQLGNQLYGDVSCNFSTTAGFGTL